MKRCLNIITLLLLLVFVYQCKKPENIVKVVTLDALPQDIAYKNVSVKGEIIHIGYTHVDDHGILLSTEPYPEFGNSITKSLGKKDSAGIFTAAYDNLTPSTEYYFKAYANLGKNTYYGDRKSFSTMASIMPTVTTAAITNIIETSAAVGGNVTDDGGATVNERGIYYGTSSKPETTGIKLQMGIGLGVFSTSLTGLSAGTTYYIKAFAINNIGIAYGNEVSFTTYISGETVTDYDGNTYGTIKIGNKVWMTENLKVTHYPNGSAIPLVTDNTAWGNLADNNTDHAYCYYNNSSSSEYGALYTYAAALNACPTGWHLPSVPEWSELENYLADNDYNYDGTIGGGRNKIAKAIAAATGWASSSITGAVGNSDYPEKRNASGFSGLPGGRRNGAGGFDNAGSYGVWWSSTEISSDSAYIRGLGHDRANVDWFHDDKSFGFSIRCVRN